MSYIRISTTTSAGTIERHDVASNSVHLGACYGENPEDAKIEFIQGCILIDTKMVITEIENGSQILLSSV